MQDTMRIKIAHSRCTWYEAGWVPETERTFREGKISCRKSNHDSLVVQPVS